MTPRPKAAYPKTELIALRVSEEMYGHLQRIQEEDGIPMSEQARRGIRLWLEERGVDVKSERKRAVTRKRS